MAVYLVTNAAANVTKYEVTVDGVVVAPAVVPQADGSLKYDGSTLASGSHTCGVRAGNIWGWSALMQLIFSKAFPVDPANLRFSETPGGFIMKRIHQLIWPLVILWVIVLLCCWNSSALAAPHAVCDAIADATVTYDFDLDGTVTSGIPVQLGWIKNNAVYLTDPGGTTTQCHVLMDLVGLPVGSHTMRVRRDYGLSGVSEWTVPLPWLKLLVTAPQAVRLVK